MVDLDPASISADTMAASKAGMPGVVNPMVVVVVVVVNPMVVVVGPKAVTSLGTPEAWMTMCPL
jgi:hypothetical protein